MNNYIDIYGRYHHKPVTEENPIPSNNGWIYTAYAVKAGLPVDKNKLLECYSSCFVQSPFPHFNRNPRKPLPPISRDEILGMCAIFGNKKINFAPTWSFSPYPIPKFNLFTLLKQLYEVRGQHRNYFWENNLDQLYRFAFSVPLSDRHFILKKWDKFQFYNPVHLFYTAFGKLQSKFKPNGLDWLKYDEKRGLEAVRLEFPEDHPIRQKLGI